ncbi:unnamed protein product [Diatraea saccharalis]|uniref:Uncharacterized protein n=1 Tax=Diatraea saccharalis TaxID=40085 RepID=A0A9N9WKY3_9NEOP|nr:unnamed protein product [Diatraea saccharalis]
MTIKNLLTDVKIATETQETLKSLDLNDLKKDILELDEKIKSFKIFLQSEQNFLKQQEQNITKKDVQKFQDFLCATAKCGGWNEYHHNIFIKIWQKYIKIDIENTNDSTSSNGSQFDQLADDFLNKVPGFTRADVTSHINWYSTYLYLKACQQRALEEWRAKNKPLKASNHIKVRKL